MFSTCYDVPPSMLCSFSNRWLAFEGLTVLDFSSCYWLPAQLITETASKLTQLEEIYLHDTRINLGHLAIIFKSCQRITKLSLSLTEVLYIDLIENLESLASSTPQELFSNFQRLTYLKVMVVTSTYYIESWPIALELLG